MSNFDTLADMTGLAEVLAAHVQVSGFDETGVWHPYGCDCSWTGASDAEHHAHVAAAVTAWLAGRLASEEVREVVADAIGDRACEYGCATFTDRRQADAALTAVVGALGVEGEAGMVRREGGNGHESDERGAGGGRVHRDAERGSNASDVIRGDG